jgi:2-polyprenyl-3-methyl-5-hydroxy-6-metoxy-1,4-benzoquinol methylase
MPFAYDVIPYTGKPFARTHPGRLAALATLYGMNPQSVDHCRVLELGCTDGGNLIPMALGLPNSEFVGVDLAGQQVATGQGIIGALGLKNIELCAADLMQVDEAWGEFDYIIAHGIYAWVPKPVRDAILRIAAQNLAPQGVAFVSYNTQPGGHLRTMFREMMLHHVSGVNDPEERVAKAQALMKFLDTAIDAKDSNYQAFVRREIAVILGKPSYGLFHDDLAECWEPVYFCQFMADAQHHGLQFLAEADYCDMAENGLHPEVVDRLAAFSGGGRLAREQYRDFLKFRRFRRTLLCHGEVQLDAKVKASHVRTLYVTSPANAVPQNAEEESAGIQTFDAGDGAQMKTAHPLVIGLITRLIEARPRLIHFEELSGEFGAENADAISKVLLSMYAAGLVEMAAWRPEFVLVAGERPMASPLSRLQANRRLKMTTLAHTCVEAEDEQCRRLVTLLDGTRDRAALRSELFALNPASDVLEVLEHELERNLAVVAKLPLLIR